MAAKVTLPSLPPKNPYAAVPRRYEETKPAINQNFSHMRILDVGAEIHRRTLEACDKECEMMVQKAEVAVWEEAEQLKKEALARAMQKAKQDQDRAIKKLNKAHDKAIKETILRVEGEMQRLALEQLQQERLEGEQRLQTAVAATEDRCHRELLDAVQQAREEERTAAADRAAEVARQNKAAYDAALKAAAEEQQRNLQELRETMQKQLEKAVAQTQQNEQVIAAKRLADMQNKYESRIEGIKEVVQKHKDSIADLEEEVSVLRHKKRQLEKELMSTRKAFQDFINSTSPYQKGESDYVLPPSKSLEIEE